MKKIVKAEKALWKVNEIDPNEGDAKFLKGLSKWVIQYFGNVNIAQRLNIIAINSE